jgi:uncharacterized protein (DUF697 family)/predicted GTPase
MLDKLKKLLSSFSGDAHLRQKLEEIRQKSPIPVFWLYGKSQSGKTSLIKFLTGADEAEIGHGFKPCTRFSRKYLFPTPEAQLLTFLDTRGVDEPGYDPKEDLASFDQQAHVVIVTVKVMDHALENLLDHFRPIRAARPSRPMVLVLTCLHEAYPQEQHPQPYPFTSDNLDSNAASVPEKLRICLAEQQRRFEGLFDHIVPIDLTKQIEGFQEPNYGGERLHQVLLEALPAGYRQTLLTLDRATNELQDLYAKRALPHIVGYSSLAATAGAFPVPWLDLLVLPGIQTRMIYHLAQLYGQRLSARRFIELASSLGMGLMVRQAVREVVKFIPVVGSVAGATLAGAATFALGKAFCFYYASVCEGHVPKAEELKQYYQEQLSQAARLWSGGRGEPTNVNSRV